MKLQKDKKWLDSALARVIGSGKPQFDAERWKEQYLKKELRRKKTAETTPNIWRIIMKSRISRLAAAAVIIIAVLIGVNYFVGSVDMAGVALGDVLEQIYNARSVTYNKTFQTEERTWTTEEMITEFGTLRSVLPHGDIMIFDRHAGKNLHLMPSLQKALITQRIGEPKKKRLFNYLDWVSKLHEDSGEFVGQKELNGKTVDVFVAEVPFEKTTVWVEPETNLPVRVEMVLTPNLDKNIVVPRLSL